MAKICSSCGLKHKDRATRCARCNAPLAEIPVFKRTNSYVILAVILLVLGGVSALFILRFTGPDGTARRIMQCYRNNDPEGIADFFPEFVLEDGWVTREDLADAISEDVENLSYHIVYFSLSDTTPPSDKEIKKIKKQLKGFPSFDEDLLEEITYVTVKCKLDHYYGFNSSNTHFLLIKYDGSWYWWPFETK